MENNQIQKDRTIEEMEKEATKDMRERLQRWAKLEYYPTREDLRALMSLIAHGKEEDKKYYLETFERIKPILPHLDRVLSNMYFDAPEMHKQ